MRFLLDEMFATEVAQRLRDLGHDTAHVRELGLAAADDEVVLAHACDHGLALATANFRDYRPLHRERVLAGRVACPLVLIPQATLNRSGPAQGAHLAALLADWANTNPEPHVGEHWPA